MSSDLLQEIIDLLAYAVKNKDWNSVDEAIELLSDESSDSVFEDEDDIEDN